MPTYYEILDINRLSFINCTIISATDVSKNQNKIIQSTKANHRPVFVYTNNTPEAVILSLNDFQNMKKIVETAQREQLGQQMVCDLLDIFLLTDQPIKKMVLNKLGVFEEVDGQ